MRLLCFYSLFLSPCVFALSRGPRDNKRNCQTPICQRYIWSKSYFPTASLTFSPMSFQSLCLCPSLPHKCISTSVHRQAGFAVKSEWNRNYGRFVCLWEPVGSRVWSQCQAHRWHWTSTRKYILADSSVCVSACVCELVWLWKRPWTEFLLRIEPGNFNCRDVLP